MDNKSLLAIVLCILILIGYQSLISYLYPPPDPLQPQTQQPVVGSESATPSDQQAQLLAERRQTVIEQGEQTPALPQPASTAPSAPVEQDIIVETDHIYCCFYIHGRTSQKLPTQTVSGDAPPGQPAVGKWSPPGPMESCPSSLT